MQNRRQHYRHAISPSHQLSVKLQGATASDVVTGELVNLSLGGMCVKLTEPGKRSDRHWIAELALTHESAPMRIPAQAVYTKEGEPNCLGFRFLAVSNSLIQEKNEEIIWKFLLAEQRRELATT